jgi:enolase
LSGLEGGYAPCISSAQEALKLIEDAIAQSNCSERLGLGIDVAASSLYQAESGKYAIGGEALLPNDLGDFFKSIANTTLKLQYLEDPFAEDHIDQWVRLREALPKVMLAGDDLVSTNRDRLSMLIERNAINSVVLKVNQCGTLTELVDCLRLAKRGSLKTIASHRSQETDSDFVTHLAVGLGADYLKAGACARERIVKYNSLLRIARLGNGGASW